MINLIRPAVQGRDGGDIELTDVAADGVVQIRFHCAHASAGPGSHMTLQSGKIETQFAATRFPKSRVIPVT